MNRRARTAAGAALVGVLLATVGTAPALARWKIHNGNDVTEMTAPAGGTEEQTCADRLVGQTGWTTFISEFEPFPDPLPSAALTAVNYEVWKAPAGFTSFSQASVQSDPTTGETLAVTFFDPITGTPLPATRVKLFTTASRTALATPIPLGLGSGGDVYVLSAAPFDEAISGVAPGDYLGLRPTGGSTFITLEAVACPSLSDYQFGGFYSPVNNPPTVNVGDVGLTYPVKFQLRDSSGALVRSLSAVSEVTVRRVTCSAFQGDRTDVLETSVRDGTALRYNTTTERYVYRWKAPATGCYRFVLGLDSGQVRTAKFQIR